MGGYLKDTDLESPVGNSFPNIFPTTVARTTPHVTFCLLTQELALSLMNKSEL